MIAADPRYPAPMRVGVGLPIGERFRYQEIRELALIAEQGGLDSIWAADHLFHEPADGPRRGIWENWTFMTALAEATQRVRFGPLVMCAPFRHPGMIAWQANALDEVSNGRFVLGLGAGWHEPEFAAFGFEFEHRVSLFADSLAIIAPLLRTGRVDYDGRFASGHATLHPRGPRSAGPPIMVAAFGPRMLRLTAKWADMFNTAWFGRPSAKFRDEIANLRAACEAEGRDPAEIEISVGLTILDNEPVARRKDDEFVTGPPEAIAEALAAWREEGVAEVMCRPEPQTAQMHERVVRAKELLG
jgi:alkanesulfonate monooxygenase SsuD/methylene tetrahydromethanopterin reductase-like flavin-dependent oxidoreductase (luciferase family)